MNYEEIKARFPLTDKGNGMKAEYLWAVDTFIEGINNNEFELYAGDCEMKDIKKHLELRDIFFMKHYIKHKETGEYFYLGFDCNHNPVGYMVQFLPKNLALICRKKAGTFFEGKK
ncbi:MAG: hypothetical protein GX675_03230 [Erysipelotrichaceae bacterium]|nr:hypothetical protein [Erysipelotrichaceae bacterium]